MAYDDLDRKISEISSRVVSAWIKEEVRVGGDFRPLVTWPEGTEYLRKVTLPEEEPLESRIVKKVVDVFSIYDLEVCPETVRELVAAVIKGNSSQMPVE